MFWINRKNRQGLIISAQIKSGSVVIDATTINDLWHRMLWHILETEGEGDEKRFVHAYPTGVIQKGSFEGDQSRLQFPGFAACIQYPVQDFIVVMPEGSGIPVPTDSAKAQRYFEQYIIGSELQLNETYTYGQRINISLWHIIADLKAKPISNQYCIE